MLNETDTAPSDGGPIACHKCKLSLGATVLSDTHHTVILLRLDDLEMPWGLVSDEGRQITSHGNEIWESAPQGELVLLKRDGLS